MLRVARPARSPGTKGLGKSGSRNQAAMNWLKPRALSICETAPHKRAVCTLNIGPSSERINNPHAINLAAILHIFREQYGATGLLGGADDQSIPEGKAVKSMQVDCG
jgi:hypothetical protein